MENSERFCFSVFGVGRENVSHELVARGLRGAGERDGHWSRQADHCGGLSTLYSNYTHRIPFGNLSAGLLALFRDRVSRETLDAMASFVSDGASGGRAVALGMATNKSSSARKESSLSPEVRELLQEYYEPDYRLLEAALV